MPLYEFYCPGCEVEELELRSMDNRNDEKVHSCGSTMERLISIPHITMRVYAKDTILNTLNTEEAYSAKEGRPARSPYSQHVLYRGLEQHSTHPGQYRPTGKNAKAFY